MGGIPNLETALGPFQRRLAAAVGGSPGRHNVTDASLGQGGLRGAGSY